MGHGRDLAEMKGRGAAVRLPAWVAPSIKPADRTSVNPSRSTPGCRAGVVCRADGPLLGPDLDAPITGRRMALPGRPVRLRPDHNDTKMPRHYSRSWRGTLRRTASRRPMVAKTDQVSMERL